MSIMGVDGTWRRSCILIDASASGAKLEVVGSTDPLKAQEFFLVLSSSLFGSAGVPKGRKEKYDIREYKKAMTTMAARPVVRMFKNLRQTV
ncbi:hypothetical protein [Bradyrhizobium sp. Ghvi]|uniref:hypothetical protein n=1 Tax=Bradyrhizobium sp. Ghvi TaxID=1855319 RepID=UPI0015A6395C|nr:hypothetical protein [Bradyrhizobium sp. Ghvi]